MCKLVEAYIKLFVQTRFHFTFFAKNIASMDKKDCEIVQNIDF